MSNAWRSGGFQLPFTRAQIFKSAVNSMRGFLPPLRQTPLAAAQLCRRFTALCEKSYSTPFPKSQIFFGMMGVEITFFFK
jgi:hypothetical protein